MPSLSLLQRLKERKLVQWVIAYLAGAFVVFQAVEVMAEPWGISLGLQRAVHILLLIGLFVTLVLAWYHGEKGRQRVSGPELLMVAALLVIAGAALSLLASGPSTRESSRPDTTAHGDGRPRVAILPCTNESPDPADAFRASGLHDEILLKLQKVSSLVSLGRASVLQFAGNPPHPTEIAASLGVGFVGECTVQRSGSRIRVIFQLLDAGGVQKWADEYDRDLTIEDILDIQIDIAQRVAQSVGAILSPEDRARIEARPTDNLQAYDFYQLGRTRWLARSVPGMYEAIGLYEAAIAQDSTYALAYAGLSETYLVLTFFDATLSQVGLREFIGRARDAAKRALTLDPDLPEAHAALGYLLFWYEWEWEAAERELRLATVLDPGNSQARAWYAEVLISQGRSDDAVTEASQAAQTDPRSLNENVAFAWALWSAGRLEEAERQFRYTMDLENGEIFGFALRSLLEEQGRFEEANQAALREFRAWASNEVLDSLVVALRAVWNPELRPRGISILQYLESDVPFFSRTPPASWYASLGAMDEAVAAARRHIEAPSLQVSIFNWPHFWPLHSDPRFLTLLDELGLPRPQ